MPFLSNLEGHFEKTKIKKKDLLLIKLMEKKEGCSWWEKKGFKKVLEPLFQHLSFMNYPRNKGFLFLFIELSQMHFSRTPVIINAAHYFILVCSQSPLWFSSLCVLTKRKQSIITNAKKWWNLILCFLVSLTASDWCGQVPGLQSKMVKMVWRLW